ncbi:ArnT family glycosyltransferase [Vibrio aquimaris]|uniref:Undecaprenyl phosphate-alpha-4-amino-4-deoxy-L-arabinose arabinosyl transferase n=1 Tax=Vibrio aquimaris TaxID=2587862 RepID=A0A5P9CI79_9VIBR|nr:glycosyltransferase family 39 protein [Vibrio aquimaris]QFT25954.1 Undecaprenyl phosphate-alpha-4-amino-4-deoxy-L-arabinose arabinosyl transferase [Vibrio aquimaris]
MSFNRVHLWILLGVTLVTRLLSLGAYPLMDTTEARYGEMARLMVETNNWITPQFDYGVPFWGKPPLFAWMSALGIKLFGVNEFAVRFPHWLAGVLIVGLVAYFAKRVGFSGLVSALVLSTSGVFLISAGAVMTDIALTLGMSLALIGFYLCWQGSKLWGYLAFLGLAIGLLAKGPLVIVLVGLAVVPWLVMHHGFLGSLKVLWQRFPMVGGLLVMGAISIPWYIAAERATPGFLNYFIIGEHIKRFVVSGWQGDLYGTAHNEARGTIWYFWLYAAAPWSLILPILWWNKRKQLGIGIDPESGLLSFLVFWMLSPMLLFTFAGNILPAYVLPGIPAMSVLIAILLSDEGNDNQWFKIVSGVVPILLLGAVIFIQSGTGNRRSDKALLRDIDPSVPTYYIGRRPFSGQFYSSGKAKYLQNYEILDHLKRAQLIGKKEAVEEVVHSKKMNCSIDTVEHSRRVLYRCERPR